MQQHAMESEEALKEARQSQRLVEQDPAGAEELRQVDERQTEGSTLTTAGQQTLQHDEVEDLLAKLRKAAHARAVRRKWFIGGFLSFVGLMALLAIFTHNFHLISQVGSWTGVLVAGTAASQAQKKLTKDLAKYKSDPRVAGPFAEALEFQDGKLYPVAADVLVELLPQMKASDRHWLNAEQRLCLYRALKGKNTALTLAILKSLQQIGDGKALPYVEKLKENQKVLKWDSRIGEEIEACLPFLADLAVREQQSETLLRAADGNATPSDVLLRAAESSLPQTEPDQLLRATTPNP